MTENLVDRRLNVLVLSTFDGRNANVIRDYLFSFRNYSRHRYAYLFDCTVLTDDIDLTSFDVIVLFWSLDLMGPGLSAAARDRLRAAPALKVLFLQDEYRNVRRFNRVMAELGINVMFTCVAESDHATFYPPALVLTLEGTYTVLTGYVPPYLDGRHPDRASPRPRDIGYRSREVPYWLGDLGREKKILADRFTALATDAGFTADISTRESDRIYGRRWVEFLRRSRFVLGSASGASVVDFTGEIQQHCGRYLAEHPDATYDEVKTRCFQDVDWKVVIDTVSPRVFEATALGCTLVHHEGGYGGVLVPDLHYICVRRDYSNIGEVVDRMRDPAFCGKLAERAYQDLIESGQYQYQRFAQRFDAILARHVRVTGRIHPVSSWRLYARNFVRHGQGIVPFRDSFVTLPAARLPYVPVDCAKGVLAIAATFGDSRRRLLLAWLRCRLRGVKIDLRALAKDLLRLHILRRTMLDGADGGDRFSARIHCDSGGERIRIESVELGSEPASQDARRWAIDSGRPTEILWDHSRIGTGLRCKLGPRAIVVSMGPDGTYEFHALVMIARYAPAAVWTVFRHLATADRTRRGAVGA